jgi:retinol dehydrogenase-12
MTYRKESKLHVLFNNAGVMASPPDMKTKQGYEQQLGVNVIGPFLFTKLLLPTLESTSASLKSDPSTSNIDYNIVRVINTSSNGHALAPKGGFNFEDPNHLGRWPAYGQSKWANIVVADEVAKRYGTKGISAHSLNPGVIRTELVRHSSWFERFFLVS